MGCAASSTHDELAVVRLSCRFIPFVPIIPTFCEKIFFRFVFPHFIRFMQLLAFRSMLSVVNFPELNRSYVHSSTH